MTFDEQQEFKVLSLLKGKSEYMLIGEIKNALNEEMGGGLWAVLHRLTEGGFIDSHSYTIGDPKQGASNPGYTINKFGERKLISINKNENNIKIRKGVYWGTFIAAIISAAGVFFTCNGNSESKSTTESPYIPTKEKEQSTLTQPHTTISDSTLGSPKSHVSLPKTKNDSAKHE